MVTSRKLDLLDGALSVTMFAHDIEHEGAVIPCVTWRTRGFAELNHPELTITLPRDPEGGLDVLALDAVRFVTSLFSRTKGGAPPIVPCATAEYPRGLFDEGAPLGAIFVRARDIEGIPLRRHGLAVVIVHNDELALARSFGARRLLSRLARHARFAPFPFWWSEGRPSVAHDDESSSALSSIARMPVVNSSVTLRGDVVTVRVPPSRARIVSEALRKHGDGAFAWLADAEPDADAVLVWEPGQTAPSAAPVPGGRGAAVAASFAMFTPAERDRGALLEDGVRFELSPDTWTALRDALDRGDAFDIAPSRGSKGLAIRWAEPRPDAPPSANYEGVEMLAGIGGARAGADSATLSAYARSVCAAVDRHFADSWHAPSQDLLVHVELHPGRRPRVDLALRPGGVQSLLNGLCAAAEAVEAPTVTSPVVFRTMWSLWGGAEPFNAPDEA